MQSETIRFRHHNEEYFAPMVFVPNGLKFELIRDIIFEYNYPEFCRDFLKIYTSYDEQRQHVAWWIHEISERYNLVKREYELSFSDCILYLQQEMMEIFGRKNSRVFHIDFITMICLWIKHKNEDNQWTTRNNSYEITHQLKHLDYLLPLNRKIERFISHFDFE